MGEPQRAFAAAARAFVELVRRLPTDRWEEPALGGWDLRALVGHTSRALLTVEAYLARPASAEDLDSPEAYFVKGLAAAPAAAAVEERGREAGRALGEDPATAVAEIAARVLPLVDRDDDPLLETIGGGMRLSRYLPTRTFELAVHGADISAAAGLPVTFPPAVLAEAAALAARAAAKLGQGSIVLAALTGRAALPAGFSVV